VRTWRDGQMALRRCAARMIEDRKQFRRVNGHLHLPALRAALQANTAAAAARTVGTGMQDKGGPSSLMIKGAATEVPRNSGQPPDDEPPRFELLSGHGFNLWGWIGHRTEAHSSARAPSAA